MSQITSSLRKSKANAILLWILASCCGRGHRCMLHTRNEWSHICAPSKVCGIFMMFQVGWLCLPPLESVYLDGICSIYIYYVLDAWYAMKCRGTTVWSSTAVLSWLPWVPIGLLISSECALWAPVVAEGKVLGCNLRIAKVFLQTVWRVGFLDQYLNRLFASLHYFLDACLWCA